MSMRKIYRKIARENGVSVKEVKEDMQAAITAAEPAEGRRRHGGLPEAGAAERGNPHTG